TDGDGSHGSTSKTPSYTKSVSWHHYHLTNTHITNCEIICPTPDVVALFENKMMPIYNKLASNTQENSHLIQLRDWLLPLLMNGQVTVK
ncbi:hypothetical protein U4V41_22780, partial [Escherichia coli]|nr:hypothetical protein [Escherichia coli]MDZ6585268.1 hypothetical protein [Escherichia coli]